jgi:hypothetical protein
VVTTSMEEAQKLQDSEFKLERQMKTVKNSLELTDVQERMFRDTFAKLDTDGGGSIEVEELAIGLAAIGDLLEGGPAVVEEQVRKADPTGRGIDLVTFVVIMCNIPSCRRKRILRRTVRAWVKRKRAGKSFFAKLLVPPPILEAAKNNLEEVFVKNTQDLNNLLFGRVNIDGTLQASTSDEIEPVRRRRRSGSWIPGSDHEFSTIVDISRDKGESGDSSTINRLSPSPNMRMIKSLSEKKLGVERESAERGLAKAVSTRSMSVGNIALPQAVGSSDGNNPKSKSQFEKGDAVYEFSEESS